MTRTSNWMDSPKGARARLLLLERIDEMIEQFENGRYDELMRSSYRDRWMRNINTDPVPAPVLVLARDLIGFVNVELRSDHADEARAVTLLLEAQALFS